MVKNHKYRFKTEQEFVQEYGDGWRNDPKGTGSTFISCMDYLLGKDIKESYYETFGLNGYFVLKSNGFRYGIQSYMYKKVSINPDYKPRKLVY